MINYELFSHETFIGLDGKLCKLGGTHLMSTDFKFLLKAACHQHEAQRLNRLYITKNNFTKWKNDIRPNSWTFFLNFGSKEYCLLNVDGIIDMNKIKEKIK